jgi:hypothetical protein
MGEKPVRRMVLSMAVANLVDEGVNNVDHQYTLALYNGK